MAVKYFVDTSAYSAFARGDTRLRDFFKPENELTVALIVVAELRAGFAAGSHSSYNEDLLQQFLDRPSVTTCTISDATTHLYAQIYAKLRQKGTPIGTNDMWIAAMTLEYDRLLLTLDSDFSRVPDLLVAKI